MNNYDLHERAQELADTHSAYELARRVIEAESRLNSILPEPQWELMRFGKITGPAFNKRGEYCFEWFEFDSHKTPYHPYDAILRASIGALVEELDRLTAYREKIDPTKVYGQFYASTTACDDQFAADPNGGES